MRASTERLGVVALLAGIAACAGVLFTAPPGSSITLFASPPFIASDGAVSVITAIVTEPAGTTVADGTVVNFFADIGRIEPQGKTKNGIAKVNFTSDSRSGVAHITAVSGGAAPTISASPGASPTPGGSTGSGTASITVTVGSIRVKAVCCLRAEPPRITISNSTHVFARVIDEFGNGIPNIPVFFTVFVGTGVDPGTEFFDITGPVFTNNSGEAENVMRTRRQTAGTAQVRASAVGAGVMVNSDPLPIPIL